MHSLGVLLVCMQSFRVLGFMVLELWRRRTDRLTDALMDGHTLAFISIDVDSVWGIQGWENVQ